MEIEKSLRNAKEVKEAEKAMLREEQLDRARFQKIKALKLLWKKRRDEKEYKMMVMKLSELSLSDMDKEIMEIEKLIKAMILVESDGVTEVMPTVDMEDMQMFDTTQSGARALEIKWLEEMEVEPCLLTEEMDTEASLPACQGGEDATMMEDNTDPTMDVGYIGMDMETGTRKNNVVEDIVEMMTGPG